MGVIVSFFMVESFGSAKEDNFVLEEYYYYLRFLYSSERNRVFLASDYVAKGANPAARDSNGE
jgi:hypothetical protein